jgi:hypothetical protein
MSADGRRAILMSAAVIALSTAGCKGGGDGPAIAFAKAAMAALPAVSSTATAGLASARAFSAAPAAGSVADYPSLVNLFRLECQHLPNDNYCPANVHPSSALTDPTRFEMGSLIGMIYHAQMYTGTLVTDCSGDGFSPMAVGAASYLAGHSQDPAADPTRFIVDDYALLTCRASNVSNTQAETRVVSAVADGSYQAALHTRYNYDAGNGPQTDFFQVYVSLSGGGPTFLAFNFSAATPHASRIVLLANLASHRFALKYYVPTQPDTPGMGGPTAFYAVATGVGGYDLETGAANPGHYAVSFSDGGGTALCVNNVGGAIEPAQACAAESVPSAWTSSAAIATYLGAPAADASRVARFLDAFANPDSLGPGDAWQRAGDENLFWPAALH